MQFFNSLLAVLFSCALMSIAKVNGKMLIDFTKVDNVDAWIESSDTVREVGMSKASLVLQKTQVFQRAVFFTLLNPQPNGAGFAGVRVPTNLDLSQFDEIRMRCRGQGQNSNYKVVLRHKGHSIDEVAYEQFFQAPISNSSFSEVILPLGNFKAYYRGKEVSNVSQLDRAHITMLGFQVYGGVYLPIKQFGVSALEIETVEAR